MVSNLVVDTMLRRKSIRRYKAEQPSEEVIETIVRAGQQAPFALQMCSLLLSRQQDAHPFRAPLLFTICIDSHRLELIMEQRGWRLVMNDLSLLLMGIQDASLMAENMVIAAESLKLGSCFLGMAPYHAEQIAQQYRLPKRVFPLVQMAMGYPAENPPPRPRFPVAFTLFTNEYHELDEARVQEAMKQMDEGYLSQQYYRDLDAKISLEGGRRETFTYTNYSWAEHISRKAGQWEASASGLLEQFALRGFRLPGHTTGAEPK